MKKGKHKRTFILAIIRYGLEGLITMSICFVLLGLFLGIWAEFQGPFRANIILLIPITYVSFLASNSLVKVYQNIADLVQAPAILVGYITLHDLQTNWRRSNIGTGWLAREQTGQRYIINVVPQEAFTRWLGQPDWQKKREPVMEADYRYDPDPDALSTEVIEPEMYPVRKKLAGVNPLTLEAPRWAFEIVRLGDLIRLTYARRTRHIYDIEVLLSVMMPE